MADPCHQQSNSFSRLPTLRQNQSDGASGSSSALPKRTFVPNVNAKKRTDSQSPGDSAKPDRPGSNFNAARKTQRVDRPKIERDSRYVQSYSLFAEGAGASMDKAVRVDAGLVARSGDSTTTVSRGSVTSVQAKGMSAAITVKAEAGEECFIADLKSGLFPPIKLPYEPPIKSEQFTVDSHGTSSTATDPEFQDPSIADFLFGPGANGRLFTVQLPHVLPSPAAATYAAHLSAGTTASAAEAEPGVKQPGGDANDPRPTMDLATFPEGGIGKLQLLKNGQVRLVIGDCNFDVDYGFSHPHLTDLCSFHPSPSAGQEGGDAGSGEMSVLGHVTDKLLIRPRVEELIEAKLHRKQGTADFHRDTKEEMMEVNL